MGMSKKAQALITAEKGSEWNKYRISMQHAYNDYAEEQAAATAAQKKKSGKAKFWGGVAFLAVAAIGIATGGFGLALAGTKLAAMGGLAGTAFGWAGTAAAGTALTAIGAGVGAGIGGYIEGKRQVDKFGSVKFGKIKEELMEDIYDPRFGAGTANVEKSALGADIKDYLDALQLYNESGALDQVLYENIGKSSSYIGATSI